jgi:hypothetical protein
MVDETAKKAWTCRAYLSLGGLSSPSYVVFVCDFLVNPNETAIVHAILAMRKALGRRPDQGPTTPLDPKGL